MPACAGMTGYGRQRVDLNVSRYEWMFGEAISGRLLACKRRRGKLVPVAIRCMIVRTTSALRY
jgi:hypothetical protein